MKDEIKVSSSLQTFVDVSKDAYFVDVSKDAYGSVVYYKNVYPSGLISSVIVAAKTSGAPLRAISAPRMKLMHGCCAWFKANSLVKRFQRR